MKFQGVLIIIPCSVNSKYTNLIVEIRLGLGLDWIISNPHPIPNIISGIKFVYLGFTEHGIDIDILLKRCTCLRGNYCF